MSRPVSESPSFGLRPFIYSKSLASESPSFPKETEVETDKKFVAKELFRVVQTHSSPPALLPQKVPFFRWVWNNFLRLLQWITGKLPSISQEELRLRFAMNLFRNLTKELLPRPSVTATATPVQVGYDLPFYVAIEAYLTFFTSCPRWLGITSNQLAALADSIKLAKTLEAAKNTSRFNIAAVVKKEAAELEKKIKNLGTDDVVYIPGQLLEYKALNGTLSGSILSGSLATLFQSKDLQATPFFCEVKKDPNNSRRLLLRIFHDSIDIDSIVNSQGRVNLLESTPLESVPLEGVPFLDLTTSSSEKVATYRIPLYDLLDGLETLLEVQITPHSKHLNGRFDKLKAAFYFTGQVIKTLVCHRSVRHPLNVNFFHFVDQHSKEKLKKFFSAIYPFKVEDVLQEKLPLPLKKQTDCNKVLEVFFKALAEDKVKRKSQKLLLKTALFLEIFLKEEAHLKDNAKMRSWLKGTCQNLLQGYQSFFGPSFDSDPDFSKVVVHMEAVALKIEKATKDDVFTLPDEPRRQPQSLVVFSQPVVTVEAGIPMDAFRRGINKSNPSTSTSKPLDFVPHEFSLEWFKTSLKKCKELIREKDFEKAALCMEDIFIIMQEMEKSGFWQTSFSQDALEWCEQFHLICVTYFNLHNTSVKTGPHPQQMVHLFKLLKRALHLIYQNNSVTNFKPHTIDVEAFYDILKDPYLDLGEDGPEIISLLKGLEGEKKETRVNLADPNNLALPWKGKGVAKQIILFREMLVLILAMMAKYRCLGNPALFAVIGNVMESIALYLKGKITLEESEEFILQNCFLDIDDKLRRGTPPQQFLMQDFVVQEKPVLLIKELGLCYYPYDLSKLASSKFPSQYRDTRQPLSKTVEEYVVDACVSNVDGSIVDENGIPLDPTNKNDKKKLKRFFPRGSSATEKTIVSRKEGEMQLSPDIWAEFQLLMSSPLATRIPNTLAFMAKASKYYDDVVYANTFQRVCSLNFFRNNALYDFLYARPETVESFIQKLNSIALTFWRCNNVQGFLFLVILLSQVKVVIKQLPNSARENLSFIEKVIMEHFSALSLWQQAADEKKYLKKFKRAIHKTFLIYFAKLFKEQNPTFRGDLASHVHLLEIMQSYFVFCQIPATLSERNHDEERQISYMMYRLFPHQQMLLENKKIRNDFFFALSSINRQWEHEKDLIYVSGTLRLDLSNGRLYEKGVAKCSLPDSIIFNPLAEHYFKWDDIKEIPCKVWPIVRGSTQSGTQGASQGYTPGYTQGQMFEFVFHASVFRVVDMPGQRNLLIYKKTGRQGATHSWHQLKKVEELRETAPQAEPTGEKEEALRAITATTQVKTIPKRIIGNFFWVASLGNTFVVEDGNGKVLYSGSIFLQGLKRLKTTTLAVSRVSFMGTETGSKRYAVLDPWKHRSFSRFLALGDPSQITALGTREKVEKILYESDLEYVFNPATKGWSCTNFPGYHLSPAMISDKLGKRLFDTNFVYYHLLEHPYNLPLLLLNGVELHQKREVKEEYLSKNNRVKVVPAFSQEKVPLYHYEIDPIGTLRSFTQEGYLYLAYVLFAQGRYELAFVYLYRAQNIRPRDCKECIRILNLFEKWKVATLEGEIFLFHVQMLVLQQLERVENTKEALEKKLPLLKGMLSKYIAYSLYSVRLKASFSFTVKQRDMLEKYARWMEETLPSLNLESLEDLKEVQKSVSALLAAFERTLDQEKRELDKEIEALKALMMKDERSITGLGDTTPSNLLFADFQNVLTVTPQLEANSTLTRNVKALNELVDTHLDGFAKVTAEQLLVDIQTATSLSQKEKSTLVPHADLQAIQKGVAAKVKELEEKAVTEKKQIVKGLKKPLHPKSKLEKILGVLQEHPDSKEMGFDQAVIAAAMNDWKTLMEKTDSDTLQGSSIINYLVTVTTLHQYRKALQLLGEYHRTNLPIYLLRLGELLAVRRNYNPFDPKNGPLLLMENQQRVIIRADQIEHALRNLAEANVFIHEPLGGGKTTLERNLDALFHADGMHGSAVATDDALMGQHHALLEEHTLAFNQLADLFEFSREHPSDEVSLKLLLRNILRVIVQQRRLDFTKKDMLSLRHLLLQQYRELGKGKEDAERIHREMDCLQDTLQVLKTRFRVGCDEMDKITNPQLEHNWGIGQSFLNVDPLKAEVALYLMKWTMEDTTFRTNFASNHQYKLARDMQSYLRYLAVKVWKEFSLGDQTTCVQYFTTPLHPDKDKDLMLVLTRFYDEHIKRHEKRKLLVYFHKFIHGVVPDSLEKRNGKHYKRSLKDFMTVKPTAQNGVYHEQAEHCTEEEVLWVTCLNYMDMSKTASGQGGVTVEQISRVVQTAHRAAANEISTLQLKDRTSFRDSPTALVFFKRFNRHLDEITEEDYPLLAVNINTTPALLANFLKNYVFPLIEIREKKFTGNSQHFVHMFEQFYGSAGTSNSYRALPDPVRKLSSKEKPFVKKPGVDGAVFVAFLKDLSDKDFSLIDDSKPLLPQISPLLAKSPGSMFIDLAPLFPGLLGKDIAEALSPLLPQSNLRYVTGADKVAVLEALDKTALTLDEKTILAKDQERGTNLEMGPLSEGHVTVNETTSLTEFVQAIMRMRKLGKGQRIKIIIDHKFWNRLPSPKHLHFILSLFLNEAPMLKKLHYKAEGQKIVSLPQNALYDCLCGLRDRDQREKAWQILAPFFEEDTQDRITKEEDIDKIGKPRFQGSAHDALKDLASVLVESVKGFILSLEKAGIPQTTLETVRSAKEELKCRALGEHIIPPLYLPSTVDTRHDHLGSHSVMQHEQESVKDQFRDQEQQKLQQQSMAKTGEKPDSFPWVDLQITSIDDLKAKQEPALYRLQDYLPFYDDGLYFTCNLYDPHKKAFPWGLELSDAPLPGGQMRIFRVAILVDKKTGFLKTIAGSIKDFDHIFYEIDKLKQSTHMDFYIYNILTDQLEGRQAQWEQYPAELEAKIHRMIVQIKHLAGETSLIGNEQAIFSTWLREIKGKKDLSLLEGNLLKYLTALRPSLLDSYPESPMAQAYLQVH